MRILFLADTHLGFDLPFKPRIERRRRGPDFFQNFRSALRPALQGEVDLVVHGGDLLYRSKVPAKLVDMSFQPLREVADRGIPVYLVPGNHERSAIPFRLLASHPNIHIFHSPRTYIFEKGGIKAALAGFPYYREGIRKEFPSLLAHTGYNREEADIKLLCLHHCVEGATVGPVNFTFHYQADVIRIQDIPRDFAAVLSGHIHRFQVLERGLQGETIEVPIFYPGSTERTSFAEKDETKGYLILEITRDKDGKTKILHWQFRPLTTRPMIQIQIKGEKATAPQIETRLKEKIQSLPKDTILQIKIGHPLPESWGTILSATNLRSLAPHMNISLSLPRN